LKPLSRKINKIPLGMFLNNRFGYNTYGRIYLLIHEGIGDSIELQITNPVLYDQDGMLRDDVIS